MKPLQSATAFFRIGGTFVLVCLIWSVAVSQSLTSATIPFEEGIDCGCTASGPYVKAKSGFSLQVNDDSTSPNGKYKIIPTGLAPTTLTVRRVSDNAVVFSTDVPGGQWGFSPDDDRFVYHYVDINGQHRVGLVNLTATGNKEVWTRYSPTLTIPRFTTSGNYLFCAGLVTSTRVTFTVIDARDGSVSHSTEFTFATGGDTVGTSDEFTYSTWGFSPDASDRTLVYAYVEGQGLIHHTFVNLQTREVVRDETLVMVSGFWGFSPCGDVLGLVTLPSPSSLTIQLFKTETRQLPIATYPVSAAPSVFLRSTSTSHIAAINGSDVALAPNLADDVCRITPDSLVLSPDSVLGGSPVSGRVTLTSPAGTGGVTVALTSSISAAATVPSSVLVPAGQREKTFVVTTYPVATISRPVIAATADGVTIRDTLTVRPLDLTGFTADRRVVIGGDTVRATITISEPAPSPGTSVTLVSSKPSLVAVPSPVLIPTGQSSAMASLVTVPVSSIDSARISAIALGDTLRLTVVVNPFVTLSFQPDTIVGGNSVTMLASRPYPAPPGGVTIQPTSSDSSVLIPQTLVIWEGATLGWVNPQNTQGVDAPMTVTITASSQQSSSSARLRVLPAKLISFGPLPDSGCFVGGPGALPKMFIGSARVLFEAQLDGQAPPAGGTFSVTSSRPDLIPPISSVPVPAFARKVRVTIPTPPVTSFEEVVLTATYRGGSRSDTLRLVPAPVTYTFTDITPPSPLGLVYMKINNANQVLMASGGGTGYFFENGVHYGIGSLAGLTLHAAALNDSGWIGGSDGSNRPAIWTGDSLRILPAPDSTMTTGWVIALNEAGEAIGLFGNYMTIGKPILWRPDSLIVLGPYIDYKIYPIDINNRSQLVLDGSYYYSFQNNSYSSFFWENGTHTRIMHPYGPEYYYRLFARAINDNGIIVLSGSQTYSDGESIMYVWESGLPAILSSLPPYNRINPSDINNSGSIVGGLTLSEEEGPSRYGAFILMGNLMYDLGCLCDVPPEWILRNALSINEAGSIVGRGEMAGMDRAFLLIPTAPTAVDPPRAEAPLPTRYALEQNFPNPFNPTTTIPYALPAQAHVRLTVYNILGQQVSVLVDEVQQPGYKLATWDAQGLASGMYFCRMEVMNSPGSEVTTTAVMRMMLLK